MLKLFQKRCSDYYFYIELMKLSMNTRNHWTWESNNWARTTCKWPYHMTASETSTWSRQSNTFINFYSYFLFPLLFFFFEILMLIDFIIEISKLWLNTQRPWKSAKRKSETSIPLSQHRIRTMAMYLCLRKSSIFIQFNWFINLVIIFEKY